MGARCNLHKDCQHERESCREIGGGRAAFCCGGRLADGSLVTCLLPPASMTAVTGQKPIFAPSSKNAARRRAGRPPAVIRYDHSHAAVARLFRDSNTGVPPVLSNRSSGVAGFGHTPGTMHAIGRRRFCRLTSWNLLWSLIAFASGCAGLPIVRIEALTGYDNDPVRGLYISGDIPRGESLVALHLILDDSSIPDADAILELFQGGTSGKFEPFCGVVYPRTAQGRVRNFRIQVKLGLWCSLENRVRVVMRTRRDTGEDRYRESSLAMRFDVNAYRYRCDTSRDDRNEISRIFLPDVPMFREEAVPGSNIVWKDADRDGLIDLWENILAEILRPRLVFEPDEDLLDNLGSHHILDLVRVAPVRSATPLVAPFEELYPTTTTHVPDYRPRTVSRFVVFRHVMTYSRDYGPGPHKGDTEDYWTLWSLDDADPGAVVSYGWASKIHTTLHGFPRLGTAQHWWWDTVYSQGPSPVFFVEENKHGMWADARSCDLVSPYACAKQIEGSPQLRPVAVNVGEPPDGETLARPFVDFFDTIERFGPHADAYGCFHGEAVWSRTSCTYNDGLAFCGGLGCDDRCRERIAEADARVADFVCWWLFPFDFACRAIVEELSFAGRLVDQCCSTHIGGKMRILFPRGELSVEPITDSLLFVWR